ncbi:MAG: ABC transporter permease [Gemmatimonadaceae bacterium]|nr:ABC transporter permease [Gemmatimonadaceae bacterium]
MSGPPGWVTVAGALARVRSWYRSIVHRDSTERAIREEFEQHIALHTARLVQQGVAPDAAAQQARVAFGHAESHRVDARASRGLRWYDQLRVSTLDVKLGLRMLVKHPVISAAAVLALAVGIPVGLAPSHVAAAIEAPLPGDPDHRIRAIRYWDPAAVAVAATSVVEYEYWSRELRSFSALAAFRASTMQVALDEGRPEPLEAAEVSAATFGVLGVVPQHGRALHADDFIIGAAPVVLIGDHVWRTRFASDPAVIGRAIRVGREWTTVVGVMPDGFRFPSYAQLWLPMRLTATQTGRGATVQIVGRLAEGRSVEQAQAELELLAPSLSVDARDAERQARLRPEVVPFGLLFMGLPAGGLDAVPEYYLAQILMLVVLLVACGNVAMLVFAQTATRFKELAVRAALGASRSRIVSQIFAETFLLALISAAAGVFLVDWTLSHVNLAAIGGQTAMPYWLSLRVTPSTVVRAVLLATLSATAAGVLPAIAITGRAVYQHMRGGSGVRFGRLTGVLVVTDIAVAVAAVGLSLAIVRQVTDRQSLATVAGVPAAEIMAVEFRRFDDVPLDSGRTVRTLVAALAAEPGVRGLAVANALPLMEQPSRPIEVARAGAEASGAQEWVRTVAVDIGYFRGLGHTVLRGRDFDRNDLEGQDRHVIVNTAFVTELLGDRDPIGARLRFAARGARDPSAWHEIVGVVPHLGINAVNPERGAAVYLPAALDAIAPLHVALDVGEVPLRMGPRVREIAQAVAPDLYMASPTTLSEYRQGDWYLVLGLGAGLTALALVLVALAASGLFAMLSLTVTERTRELGIRAALGASPRTLVWTVLRRSVRQIGLGAALGLPLAAYFVSTVVGESSASPLWALLIATGVACGIVLIVAAVSCAVPMRRVLAIEASIAMRAEA